MLDLLVSVMAYNRTARKTQQSFWSYDSSDPTAVGLRMPTGGGVWAEWSLSRAMLGDAYVRDQYPDGGDLCLRLLPGDERLVIIFYPHDDHPTVVSFPAGEVWEFLCGARKAVPPCPDGGRCVGIVRDACPECCLVGADLDLRLAAMLDATP